MSIFKDVNLLSGFIFKNESRFEGWNGVPCGLSKLRVKLVKFVVFESASRRFGRQEM